MKEFWKWAIKGKYTSSIIFIKEGWNTIPGLDPWLYI